MPVSSLIGGTPPSTTPVAGQATFNDVVRLLVQLDRKVTDLATAVARIDQKVTPQVMTKMPGAATNMAAQAAHLTRR